jgi:tRNA (guanine37-N1)-methyltransferase
MTTPASEAGAQGSVPRLRFDIFSLFPGIVAGPLDESILRRAQERGIVTIALHDIRDWATDRHRSVDDTPYGGGPGMVMMAPPVVSAVEETLGDELPATTILVMSAAGRLYTQAMAEELATRRRIAIVCGRYEGIDDRAIQLLHAEEVSIGDYVLTGGELAAAVIVDSVTRLVPGVIDAASVAEESHRDRLVEYPHFTRPAVYRGLDVPPVLLGGHHAEIARWRREQALRRTARRRPDLLDLDRLPPREQEIVTRELTDDATDTAPG